MGTEVLVAGLAPGDAATVLTWLRRVERTFSRFLPESDMGRVNAGGETEVSELFLVALGEAMRWAETTGGLFSPWLATELCRAGYASDFAGLTRATPADAGRADAGRAGVPQDGRVVAGGGGVRARSGPDAGAGRADGPRAGEGRVEVDFERRTVRVRGGVGVDLGGFVKGWSVQQAADALRSRGVRRGLIDAGGDLVCWRAPLDPPWGIGVEHPLGGVVTTLEPPPGATAVATSSVVRRSWPDAAGNRLHHLIDPRTGRPAGSDCLQATVITGDLGAAEVYAKCLVILGTREGPRWLATHAPTARGILVHRDGTITTTPGSTAPSGGCVEAGR